MDQRPLHVGDTPSITISFSAKNGAPVDPAVILLNVKRGDGREYSILHNVKYTKTAWDPNHNKLRDGRGKAREALVVAVSGTADFGHGPITFQQGDVVFYNGARWRKACRPAPNLEMCSQGPGVYSVPILLDTCGWWHFDGESGLPYATTSHSILIH